MNILFVDDDYSRYLEFRRNSDLSGHNVYYARDTVEATSIYLNAKHSWDLIMLDHDLGPKDTIMPFVSILIDNKTQIRCHNTVILIHSLNPFGAADIIKTLAMNDMCCNYIPNAFYFDIKRWAYWN